MKIARKHITAVMELAQDSNGWIELRFKKYVLGARKYRTSWKVKFWPRS